MRHAVLFPGQGSQFVGMGEALFDARPDLLGEPADRVLGWSLRAACLEGPEEALTRTDRAQPALYAVAYALWSELSPLLPEPPIAAAGHSLGEYTALAAAGAVDYLDGLRLVAARGSAMDEASRREPSGMAALIGADPDTAEAFVADRRRSGGRLWVANLNAPGQVVVAGGAEDLEWVVQNARAQGIRRAIPLSVAGAFHTPFMDGAEPALRQALASASFSMPRFPVWGNVEAAPIAADRATDLLARQVTAPVRFADSLAGMAAAGARVFIHVGPGDVTAGMAKRTVDGAVVLTVSDLGDVEPAVEALGTMARSEEDT